MTVAAGNERISIAELKTVDIRRLLASGRLGEWTDSPLPVPSVADLVLYAESSERAIVWLLFSVGVEHVALLPFIIEQRRIRRVHAKSLSLAGYVFFDYMPFCCKNEWRPLVLEALRCKAKSYGVDIAYLNNVLYPETDLPKYVFENDPTQLFDVGRARNGWRDIRSKKSLARHYNKVRKLFDYRVKHYCGDFDDSLLDTIASLHVERWGFDGIRSPLSERQRRAVYIGNRSSAVLTVLWAGSEIFAAHYGLRFGPTMIWHTPVVNIKYWEYSPLEVMLLEVIKYCEGHSIEILDYGLGAESYKSRFSNGNRRVFDVLLPVSWRGHTIVHLHRFARTWLWSWFFRNLVPKLRHARSDFARLGIRTRFYISGIDGDPGTAAVLAADHRYREIDNYVSFVDFARSHEFGLRRYQYERLRRGDRFICLVDDGKILSHGWASGSGGFRVEETGEVLTTGDFEVLYDFHTPHNLRRRGFFGVLVKTYRARHAGKRLLTYSLSGMAGAREVIEKAGFEPLPRSRLRALCVLK
jgi:CelD/BcsL family acetyltransferase involved in cellulose biosynthesis